MVVLESCRVVIHPEKSEMGQETRMRVVGYDRAKTATPLEHGLRLEAQEAKRQPSTVLYELERIGIDVDRGVSAKPLRRPVLSQALARLPDGTAESLLVLKVDRATRSGWDVGELIERDVPSGRSDSAQIDTWTSEGPMIFTILVTV
jgi:DNA invertase Pin-like site-specific DNA recombinase